MKITRTGATFPSMLGAQNVLGFPQEKQIMGTIQLPPDMSGNETILEKCTLWHTDPPKVFLMYLRHQR
jgi:hypothetical protein